MVRLIFHVSSILSCLCRLHELQEIMDIFSLSLLSAEFLKGDGDGVGLFSLSPEFEPQLTG